MKKAKVDKALEYARVLLDSVGLSEWSVGVNKSASTVGIMDHDKKTIEVSDRYITIATKEDFRKVVMHEATHALLGKGKGHNEEFAKLCTRLYPKEPFSGYCITAPIQRYLIACSNCGHSIYSNKKDEGCCIPCAMNGNGVYKLENTINKLEVTEWASTP